MLTKTIWWHLQIGSWWEVCILHWRRKLEFPSLNLQIKAKVSQLKTYKKPLGVLYPPVVWSHTNKRSRARVAARIIEGDGSEFSSRFLCRSLPHFCLTSLICWRARPNRHTRDKWVSAKTEKKKERHSRGCTSPSWASSPCTAVVICVTSQPPTHRK